jgi:hypothetical protein
LRAETHGVVDGQGDVGRVGEALGEGGGRRLLELEGDEVADAVMVLVHGGMLPAGGAPPRA